MRIHRCALKLTLFSELIEPLLKEEPNYLQQPRARYLRADMRIKVLKFDTARAKIEEILNPVILLALSIDDPWGGLLSLGANS